MSRKYTRKPLSLSSFPSEFFQIWDLACEGKLSLPFPTRGKATNMKHRLYQFRKLLLVEHEELGGKYYQVDLDVREEEEKYFLETYIPEWKKVLRESQAARTCGEEGSPRGSLPGAEAQSEPSKESQDHLSDTLKDLGFKG